MKPVNKNVKGCPICQNPRISSIADPILFECEMTVKELVVNLENQGILVEEDWIRDHITHIFSIGDEEEEISTKPLKISKDVKNLDIVIDALNGISENLKRMRDSGEENTKEYISLLKEHRDWLTLKSKLEGELNEGTNVFVIPEYITKSKQMMIQDAEIIRKSLPDE